LVVGLGVGEDLGALGALEPPGRVQVLVGGAHELAKLIDSGELKRLLGEP